MTLNEYQDNAHVTSLNTDCGGPLGEIIYPVLKLAGEAGEVAEKVGKILRDKRGICSAEDKINLMKELGDVLWYVAEIATQLHLSLEEVAMENLKKLSSRKERGVIQGSGDNR